MCTPKENLIFKMPDLGEGLEEATITAWHVAVGDVIKKGDLMVDVETIKVAVEIPAPYTGTIVELHAEAGATIAVGTPLVTIGTGTASAWQDDAPQTAKKLSVAPTLEPLPESVRHDPEMVAPDRMSTNVRAMPIVHRRAAELGADIEKVKGTGQDGIVVMSDVEGVSPAVSAGTDEGAPLSGFRLAMCRQMERSLEVVAVTIFDDANVASWGEKVPVMAHLVRAVVEGCKASPALNAWFDSGTRSLTTHTCVDLGIAVDTPHGLFVPTLGNVESRNESDIRAALKELVEKTRAGKIYTDAARKPTITLTSFGPIGGRYATPIIVPPQVAILGAGRIYSAWPPSEKRLPLSLSFDHRVVTGGEASRFLAAVKADLEK